MHKVITKTDSLLVEITHIHVLDRTSHALQVLFIAYRLKVSTAEEEVHFEAMNLLQS